jgi:iron complex transport system ATP-binding protein
VIIRLDGVSVRRSGRTILGPLDWAVMPGERWVVLGANGSGKSTLLSVVDMGLWPTTGRVEILGERYGRIDVREHRRRIGLAGSAVEASFRDDLQPTDLIMTARHAATEPWWHDYTDGDRRRARDLAVRFGLEAVMDHPFGSLSAGERRRTSIARALMPDPELLLLDEPTASLDLGARETLLLDLTTLAEAPEPAAIILVTHHVEEIPAGFGHALVLRRGAIVTSGPIDDVLTDENLSVAYDLPIRVDRRAGRATARLRR